MKLISCLLFALIALPAYSLDTTNVDHIKLNGPECTRYLSRAFKIKAVEAYQICSVKKAETKICLLEKNKNSNKDLSSCIRK